MGAGTRSNITASALSQVTLISITSHISVPGWTTPSSKCSKPRCSHCSQVAQRTTHNCSICKIPAGITHSAPLAKEENLNTPLLWTGPSHKSNSSLCCCVIQCVTYVYEMECSRARTKFGSIATFQSLRIFLEYIFNIKSFNSDICSNTVVLWGESVCWGLQLSPIHNNYIHWNLTISFNQLTGMSVPFIMKISVTYVGTPKNITLCSRLILLLNLSEKLYSACL